jgi:hypothetical protein
VQVRGCKTFKRSESNRYDRPLLGVGQYRPGDSIAESPASEHPDYDPKDCELYLGRMKPGESLVEVRNNADVQIACQIWANPGSVIDGSRCCLGVVGPVLIRLPAGRRVTKSCVSRSEWKFTPQRVMVP